MARRERYERLGLGRITIDGEQADVMRNRIKTVRDLHIGFGVERLSIDNLTKRVDDFGLDCYFQGLVDAMNPEVRKLMEKGSARES